MHRAEPEIEVLQQLLDASRARTTDHLREIIHGERVLSARDLVALLTGMKVLSVATVHGRRRASHQRRRRPFPARVVVVQHGRRRRQGTSPAGPPSVSVAHVDIEQPGVFSHGLVEELAPADPDFDDVISHWTAHCGGSAPRLE